MNKPGAWITPAMLDKIEADDPLCLLSHGDAWYNWPQRWKALREMVDNSEVTQRERDSEAMEKLRKLSAEGSCPCLCNDDHGHWALSESGTQPAHEKPDEQICWIENEKDWKDDPADAILQGGSE